MALRRHKRRPPDEGPPPRRWFPTVMAALLAIIVVASFVVYRLTRSPPPSTTITKPIAVAVPKPVRRLQPIAPLSEGGLVVVERPPPTDEAPYTDHSEIRDLVIDVCTSFATSFTLGDQSRASCSRRTPEGEADAREKCRAELSEAGSPMLFAQLEEGKVTPDLDVLRKCAESFRSCDERAAFPGNVPRGEPCYDSVECELPFVCGSPDVTVQDFRCIELRVERESCEDSVKPCAKTLNCVEGTCRKRPRAGGNCAGGVTCAEGLACSDDEVCRPERARGQKCEEHNSFFGGRSAGTCSNGLLCIEEKCIAPVESGASCEPGVSICAGDCDVCRRPVAGDAPVCTPRGAESEGCGSDEDCLVGLECSPSSRSCVPSAPLPVNGEGCAEGACADGLACVRGVCASKAPGQPCESAGDCTDGWCQPDKTCALLPKSGPCAEGTCAGEHHCVEGQCIPHLSFGAACGTADPYCMGQLTCIDGRCMPRRWGGEPCADDNECQGGCLPSKICRAARP